MCRRELETVRVYKCVGKQVDLNALFETCLY